MLAAVVLSVFAAQTLRIQGIDRASFAQEGLAARQGQGVVVPATRGDITDRFGTVLAASVEVRTVVVDQTAVCTYTVGGSTCDPRKAATSVRLAALKLAPLLGTSADKLVPQLTGSKRYVVIGKAISTKNWRKIKELQIPGVYSTPDTKRIYPTGSVSSSLVGFMRGDGEPGSGLELQLDSTLAGKNGEEKVELSQDGVAIPNSRTQSVPAVPGANVALTIDSDLQWFAQNAVAAKVRQSRAQSGTAVVMNAKTGELLAVASYPTFDPTRITSASVGSLTNRAFSDVFEPGSTAKVITMAAALEEKTLTPNTPVIVPSRLYRADKWFRDAEPHGTEYLTATGALAKSSNMGLMLISETMSSKTLYDYYRAFGLGQRTGAGYPGESKGLLTPYKQWNGTQRYTMTFGQGMSVTAIQDASVFQTIANAGVRMPPRLIKEVDSATGEKVATDQSKGTRVVSDKVARQVSAMLEGVVSREGTAPAAVVPGYRSAGKTGTANRYDPKLGKYSGYTSSFIGYAPADDPQLVVAVIVQRPKKGRYGGEIAAPVFKEIMAYGLQRGGIPPTGTKAPKVTVELPRPPAKGTPGVIGPRTGRR